jgi:CheY-like chemotaxis protein/HPt (histidine-containing phosphotransfer) domain-containing protein
VPPKLQDLPVLVVDDNATNRRILRDLLTNWEMKPTVVESGAAALAALRQAAGGFEPFRLVLLDVMMPEMDGFTVAAQIKADQRLGLATIIMLTSGGQKGDAARCHELGVASYLIKPILQAELYHAILSVLRVSNLKSVVAPAASRPLVAGARRLRILLAEDNGINQTVAVRMLEKQGHEVVVVGTGKEALAVLERQSFDLVLMDVQMPEMDGLEATTCIREREKGGNRHIPIIAMTAHAMKGDRDRCLNAGMDGYVAKPIQAAELYRAIDSLLGRMTPGEVALPREEILAPAFHREAALERLGGDETLLMEVMGLFLQDGPHLLQDVRDSVAQGDAPALNRTAHALKGSAGYLGAAQVSAAAQALESLGKSGDLAHAPETLQILEKEMERLLPVLAEQVSQPTCV